MQDCGGEGRVDGARGDGEEGGERGGEVGEFAAELEGLGGGGRVRVGREDGGGGGEDGIRDVVVEGWGVWGGRRAGGHCWLGM